MKTEYIKVTPAQKELLELLNAKEVYRYMDSLEMVLFLATYCVRPEIAENSCALSVDALLECIRKMAAE
tara:strand:- start:65 stop:271 length:207 start_codon:yes stop_codon:yes gene_type:complete